jgi:hypothetical protein
MRTPYALQLLLRFAEAVGTRASVDGEEALLRRAVRRGRLRAQPQAAKTP